MPQVQFDNSVFNVNPVPLEMPQNALANALKLAGARQKYDTNAFKLDSDRQEMARQNALAQILGRGDFNPQTPQGQAELYRAGGVKGAQTFMKGQADIDKVKSDASKSSTETEIKVLGMHRDELSNVRNPQEMAQWMAAIRKDPRTTDFYTRMGSLDEAVARIPQTPQEFEEFRQKIAMGMTKYTEMNKPQIIQQNLGDINRITAVPGMGGTPRTLSDAQIGVSPDSVENRAIQRRGQDMTDARARDLNATRVEENRIKREAKDDTNNLTKQSQIASFDTMLGTLDRLGKHPGLARSVGVIGAMPTMPGSDSANFQAELNTFQSQAFLPMVAQLKGMGALSDAEGKKLTAAVGALDPKMGEKAFRESVKRITEDMAAAKARMQSNGKSSMNSQDSAALAWAKANPNDPRAARIMQLQGQ
jgi:hypothetical protein